MKLTKSKLKEIIREEIQQLNEAEYTQTYKSIKDMDKDRNRIWTITGYPRVNISFGSEINKNGTMKPSWIKIEGDKVWVDAYKKIAFKGNGKSTDVIKYVREKTGNDNA